MSKTIRVYALSATVVMAALIAQQFTQLFAPANVTLTVVLCMVGLISYGIFIFTAETVGEDEYAV